MSTLLPIDPAFAGNSGIGSRRAMGHKQTALLRVLLDLVHEFEPDFVLLENVARARNNGQLKYIQQRLGSRYTITHGTFTAASVGMQHYRNRLFVLAVKKGTPFCVPELPADCLAGLMGTALGSEPERCVMVKPAGWRNTLHALGNAVVPAVVLLAIASLSGQGHVVVPQLSACVQLEFDNSFYKHRRRGACNKRRKLPVLTGVEWRRLWATPRASSWGVYTQLTARGLWDLGTQVRFEKSTPHRDWHVSPAWVSWLMGFPAGYVTV